MLRATCAVQVGRAFDVAVAKGWVMVATSGSELHLLSAKTLTRQVLSSMAL